MIQLSSEHLQAIRNHAESIYPEECCGIIFGHLSEDGKTVVEIMPTENAWSPETATDVPDVEVVDGRRRRYAITPQVMLAVQKEARARSLCIIGIYHSHPDYPAIPSEFDRQCAWQEYSYMIISVQNGTAGEINSWCLDENHQFQPEEIEVTKKR
ncbi:Mov34/MPN/PAD-1 family protein [Fischerella sp. PCC 9605]|uniref:Mov34/MPN/PAD-1 family protein n=1 Tax=Fischerella sp. PCC 9605 TaxID=1173024 RepID=UPI00047896F6|nr:M67 family metallopeptidase [Fischerella sp. PCC 9605]